MTEIILIRHGETQWNRDGRIQGHRQTLLNGTGRQQAERLGERLRDTCFQALYSSDLQRAVATARAIARLHDRPIIRDPQLREWDLGVLSGLTRDIAVLRHPTAYAVYRDNQPERPIAGGESIRQRYQRVTACVEQIAASHTGQTVIIVTHGGPLGDCYRRAANMPLAAPRDFQLYNAGINRFTVVGDQWTLNRWGDIDHLSGIDTLGNWVGRR